jgi:hypothetical protein
MWPKKKRKTLNMYSDLYYPLPQGTPRWIIRAMETNEYPMYSPQTGRYERNSMLSKFFANATVRAIRNGDYRPSTADMW